MQRVPVRLPSARHQYEIKVGSKLITALGDDARTCLGTSPRRAALISNAKVFALYGNEALRSLRRAGFAVSHWLMPDGERHKSFSSYQRALAFLSQAGLERNDCAVALGGGVVGDLTGFAAATYLRGIDFIQVPTTLLAQIDASVGGKTGINTAAGKNLVGAFHQPRLVVIDTETLRTLSARELTAGWCEAVKHGAVGDRKLFNQTVRLLESGQIEETDLAAIIAAHCRFKARIVAGDERESTSRSDAKSRKILNFGHTTAHALEAVTHYRRFRHGEAVGYGMLVAGEISKNLGMLEVGELELLRAAVRACGSLPRTSDINVDNLLRGMKGDKKSVAGRLKWVLLEKIGKPRIVDGRDIDSRVLKTSVRDGVRHL